MVNLSTGVLTRSASVPMDECQSSHIKNFMTRLTTIKCDKIYRISFALTKSAGVFSCGFNLERFGHYNFADLALWNHTYSYITKETVIKTSNFQLKPLS